MISFMPEWDQWPGYRFKLHMALMMVDFGGVKTIEVRIEQVRTTQYFIFDLLGHKLGAPLSFIAEKDMIVLAAIIHRHVKCVLSVETRMASQLPTTKVEGFLALDS